MSATLLVAAGGAAGSVLRFWLTVLAAPVSRGVPWGTVGINVAGSFVIGVLATVAGGRLAAGDAARALLMVGVCGGFTTFSSFSLQTLELLRAGAVLRAGVNIVASVVLCLAAVAAGALLGGQVGGAPP